MVLSIREEGFYEMADYLSDGLVIFDQYRKVFYANKSARELLDLKIGDRESDVLFCHETHTCISSSGEEMCATSCPVFMALKSGSKIMNFSVSSISRKGKGGFLLFPAVCIPVMEKDGDEFAVVVFHDTVTKNELEEQLLIASRQDHLTGLYNRQFFNELFTQEAKMREKHGGTISGTLIGIPNIRDLNEEYGDESVDELLISFAKTISSTMRKVDICCRYKGNAFAILCIDTPHDGAKRGLDRIEENLRLVQGNIPASKVKISVSIHTSTENFKDTFKIAEQSLKLK